MRDVHDLERPLEALGRRELMGTSHPPPTSDLCQQILPATAIDGGVQAHGSIMR
jgi:hypothetical protein